MESGPFRTPQPADRRVGNRQEPPTKGQPPQEPQSVIIEEPKPVYRASTPHHTPKEESNTKRLILVVVAVVVLVLLALGGWFAASKLTGGAGDTGIDTSKYQAVFFTNGQVYFGKLQKSSDQYLKLTKIYYLQTESNTDSQNPQQTSTNQSSVKLIKLGEEIHGPEDAMMISRDQVLFYENLKPDSKVSQLIDQNQKSTK